MTRIDCYTVLMILAQSTESNTSHNPSGSSAGSSTQIADQGLDVSQIVAIAGMIFCVLATGLYIALFYFVSLLPAEQQQLEQLRGNTVVLIRLVMLGASAGLLNLVALILCGIAMVLSPSTRWIAITGAIISMSLLLSVGAVVFLSCIR